MNRPVRGVCWKKERLIMHHTFMKGNIVRSKKDGQIMEIEGVRQNPFDNTSSEYIVCSWVNQNGKRRTQSFHVDEVEFVSLGNIKPYNTDDNPNSSIW